MKIQLMIGGDAFEIDPAAGRSLAIDLQFDGPQPIHFGVQPASYQALETGDFVGDTRRGGSCNVGQISMVPHCQGTHTETVGHIVNQPIPIGKVVANSFQLATLISVTPASAADCEEHYSPELDRHDEVITSVEIVRALGDLFRASALIIRTLPNDDSKVSRVYGNERFPPFFTAEAIELLNQIGVEHLLVDLPSLDKTHDDGLLTNHHLFWNVPEGTHELAEDSWTHKTITEMIFVPDEFADGVYFLNLQTPAFELDAAPSRPILFEMT